MASSSSNKTNETELQQNIYYDEPSEPLMLTDLQDIQQSGQIRQNTKQDVTYTEPEFVFLPKKRTKRYTNHRISINELSVDVSEHEGDSK